MPSEHSPDVKLEIGHVLFIDIVGYSKLLIKDQSELLTPALLRLDPMFDPLRNNPRFQKLCEEKQSENR